MRKKLLLTLFLFLTSTILITNGACIPANFNIVSTKKVFPRQSFIFVEKKTVFFRCSDKKSICIPLHTGKMTGSASIIHHRGDKTFLMTAAHLIWMLPIHPMLKMLLEKKGKLKWHSTYTFTDINGKKHKLKKIIKSDKKTDLAIVAMERSSLPALPLSRKAPEVKDRLFNIAAPAGVFETNMVPFFEGRFLGYSKKYFNMGKIALTNIPVAGGSSGSPILNCNGEIVGMVSAVHRAFHHISISPTHEQIFVFFHKHLLEYGYGYCALPSSGEEAARRAFENSGKQSRRH